MRIEFPQGTSIPHREVITRALTNANPSARVWIVPKPPTDEERLRALIGDAEDIDADHQAANPTAPPRSMVRPAVVEQWECRRVQMSDGGFLWRVLKG